MADVRKVLGQVAPAANTEVALYTAPYAANLNIVVTNRGKQSATFRIRIAVADAAVDLKQYIAYDKAIGPNERLNLNDLEVMPTDVIYVKASTPNITAQAFGYESTS